MSDETHFDVQVVEEDTPSGRCETWSEVVALVESLEPGSYRIMIAEMVTP